MSLNTRLFRWVLRSLLVTSVLLIASPGKSQTPPVPNVGGTWELVQIDFNKKGNDPKFPKMTLIIEQELSRLKFTEKRIRFGKEEIRTFAYRTDRSGETNTGRIELWRTQEPQLESVTRAEKNRIVTEYKHEWNLATTRTTVGGMVPPTPVDVSSQLTSEWSLDASRKELTLRLKVVGLAMDPRVNISTVKLKFRRI